MNQAKQAFKYLLIGFFLICVGTSQTRYFETLAQVSATGSALAGVVSDQGGAVISGASITIKNTATNATRTTTSGEDGSYNIAQLPPGIYEVTVTAEGFSSKTFRFELDLGTVPKIDVSLQVGASADVVEVRGSTLVEEGRTSSKTNVDSTRIASLPINQRNFLDFTLTAARATRDGLPPQGTSATSGLSFNGQPARFNKVTIDGLSNNDIFGGIRTTFGQDAVQEFQIVSDGLSAEFGGAIGGTVNIVTKGGSNEFHGQLFYFNRNDQVSARDAFSRIKPPFSRYQFGTIFSGPIKRDKTFFFSSFERLTLKQNNIVTITPTTAASIRRIGFPLSIGAVPVSVGTTTVLARVDHRFSDNDLLWVRYNGGFNYNGALDAFGGLVAESTAGVLRSKDNNLAVNNTYINTKLNLVNETRFLFNKPELKVPLIDPGPLVVLVAPEGQIQVGRSALLPQLRDENLFQFVNNVSLSRGKHQLKFGGDFLYLDEKKTTLSIFVGGQAIFAPLNFAAILGNPSFPLLSGLQAFDPSLRTPDQRAFLMTLAQGIPGNPPLADLSIPANFLQSFGDPNTSGTQKTFSMYFEDNIKLRPNLLLKAGIRYDITRTSASPSNSGLVSPRLGLSFNPFRKLQISASYGLYNGTPLLATFLGAALFGPKLTTLVQPFPLSVAAFAQPGRRFPTSTTLPTNAQFIKQLQQAFTTNPKLVDTYTQQINFRVGYFLDDNTVISGEYTYVKGIRLLGSRNINPIIRPQANGIQSAVTGRVDTTKGLIFEISSAYDSFYHAGTFTFNRRLSKNVGLLAHYTFAKAIDNSIDFRVPLLEVDNALRPDLEKGLSLQDIRSRFVASGVWNLDYTKNIFLRDFQLSSIVTLESGRPYNLLAGVDLNRDGDTPVGDRPRQNGAPVARNSGLRPGFASMDVRVTRRISIKEKFKIEGTLEAFNIFNRVNIDQINRTFGPDALGRFALPAKDGSRFTLPENRFRSAFSARTVQIGFRLSF